MRLVRHLLLGLILMASACSKESSEPTPAQQAELAGVGETAEAVVVVKRTGEVSAFPALKPPVTKYAVHVESRLKGQTKELIGIRQQGFFRDAKTIPKTAPHLAKATTYLLFLDQLEGEDLYVIVGGGMYVVDERGDEARLASGTKRLPTSVDMAALRRQSTSW